MPGAAMPADAVPSTTTALAAPQAARTPPPVKELNALALMWTVFKGWLAGLFGKKA